MLIFCAKCGVRTEQSYIGSSLNPPRIVTRCSGCRHANFTDAYIIDEANRKIRHDAKIARAEEARAKELAMTKIG